MKNIREARNHSAGKILKYHEGDVWNMGEVEILQKLENDISEIKEMLKRLEIMLIGEEEIWNSITFERRIFFSFW